MNQTDVSLYETGHISGALKIDWGGDPNDPLFRDYVGRDELQRLGPENTLPKLWGSVSRFDY